MPVNELFCTQCRVSLSNQQAHVSDKGNGLLCDKCHAPVNEKHPLGPNARLIAAAPTMYQYIDRRAKSGDSEAAELMEAINGNTKGNDKAQRRNEAHHGPSCTNARRN